MRWDRREDRRLETWEQDGAGEERVWENLRPRRWFSQAGAARENRHAERPGGIALDRNGPLSIVLETKESI